MIKLNKKNASGLKKVGFTLLEMVLVLAIMMIMFTYLVSTFQIVANSHTSVAMINDLHDYGSMNLLAIQNNLINATSIGKGGDTISVKDGNRVAIGSSELLPSYSQYKGNANGSRWKVDLSFDGDSGKKMVYVTITFKDSMDDDKVAYTDTITCYCPSCKEFEDVSGSSITFSK